MKFEIGTRGGDGGSMVHRNIKVSDAQAFAIIGVNSHFKFVDNSTPHIYAHQ